MEELDTDKVQFVSAENRSLKKMRLFGCKAASLVQVESGVRSSPKYTLIVENPMLKSFSVLFGLRSMSDLGLIRTIAMVLYATRRAGLSGCTLRLLGPRFNPLSQF